MTASVEDPRRCIAAARATERDATPRPTRTGNQTGLPTRRVTRIGQSPVGAAVTRWWTRPPAC